MIHATTAQRTPVQTPRKTAGHADQTSSQVKGNGPEARAEGAAGRNSDQAARASVRAGGAR